MLQRGLNVFWRHFSICVVSCSSLLLTTACRTPPPDPAIESVRRSQPLLGTFVVITVYSPSKERAHSAINAAFDEIRRADSVFSIHRPDSELSRVSATQGPVTVSEELFTVVARALEIARQTDGAFDPTVRPLVELWGFLWKEHRFPGSNELASTLPRVDYRFVELDPARRTIRFLTNGVSLDLNAIAKGYAVDCAIEKLRALGITNAMVRAGGDLRVIGSPPGETAWTVQLEDPNKRGERRIIKLRDQALSTAGSYENFFIRDGKRYSHVLNPRTGLPVEGIASCSVLADTCMESDAWSTALFVLGPDRALQKFGPRMSVLFGIWTAADAVEFRRSPSFPPVE
jgi:FAD:protein FMN transferase